MQIRNFWEKQLSGVENSSAFIPDVYEKTDNSEQLVSSAVAAADVRALAKRHHIPVSAVYLAAVLYTASVFCNETRITISTISSGRQRPEIANDFGMFVNTLPFTAEINHGSVKDFLTRVANDLQETVAHDNIPFSYFSSNYNLKPDIMFSYQESVPDDSFSYEGLNQYIGFDTDGKFKRKNYYHHQIIEYMNGKGSGQNNIPHSWDKDTGLNKNPIPRKRKYKTGSEDANYVIV